MIGPGDFSPNDLKNCYNGHIGMLVTAIVDPSALATDLLRDKAYRLQVQQFLKGIYRNGLLVSDRERKLIEEMKVTIQDSGIASLFFDTILRPNNPSRIIYYKVPIPDKDIKNVCYRLDSPPVSRCDYCKPK